MRMTSEVTVTLAVLWEGEVGAGVLENTVHGQNSVGQLGCSGLKNLGSLGVLDSGLFGVGFI